MVIFVCIVLIQFQGCGLLDRMQKRRQERQQHREERFDKWREEREEKKEIDASPGTIASVSFKPFNRFRNR